MDQSPTKRKEGQGEIIVTMDFPDAMREVVEGKKVTKLDWQDKRIYVCLHEEFLRIRDVEDNTLKILQVSKGDMLGEDWIIVD